MSKTETTPNLLLADGSSKTTTKVIKFSHIWTIENFTFFVNEPSIKSVPFGAENDSGTRWCFELYPRGFNEANKGNVSLYLKLISSAPSKVHTMWKTSILNPHGQSTFGGESQNLTTLTLGAPRGGWNKFIALQSLLEKRSTYIPDDRLTLRYEISYALKIECESRLETRFKPDFDSSGILHELYESRMLPDVKLSLDKKDFRAHRAVLAARSPVLRSMLEIDHRLGRETNLRVSDMNEETLKNLLRFIYTGEADIPENMQNLLITIDKHVRRT